ncbi:MAG: glycosyltransferase family 2 protein [Clostridia bacterium]|nr:glycosyltransferase family 2 protein [Clostridia bacterium]
MNTIKKRFSIILATYNIENYVDEAIESVLSQSFENYELLIVDDCSTDTTSEKIKKYESENVKIYSTKANTGTAGGARNVGLRYAKGEYILFLDGDDRLYNKGILEKIDKLIGDEYYDVVYLGYQDLGNENKVRISNKENSTKESRITCDVSFSVSSRCWSSKFIKENNMKFIEGMFYEDEAFCIKANILANKTTCGEFPIFKYRRNRKGSVMTTPSIKKCSDWYRMLGEVVDLLNITPEEYKPYLLSFIKNESDSIPYRVKAILKSLTGETKTPVFPKRNYEFIDFMGENNEQN